MNIWKKVTNNWSWFDSIVGWAVGIACGVIGTMFFHLWFMDRMGIAEIMFMLRPTFQPIALLVGCIFFFGRAWAIARYPRPQKINLDKLGMWGFLHQNFVSLIAGIIAIIFALGLAPSAITAIKAITN